MLQALSDVVRNVAIIILLTTFLDMLLPNNNMQSFIKVVMGLFVMVAILNPIVELLKDDFELSAWQLSLPTEEKVDTILTQGKVIASLQQNQALDQYKDRLEKQIEALVKLIPKVGGVKCSVLVKPINKVGLIGKINKVVLWVSLGENSNCDDSIKPVEPVKIEFGDENPEKNDKKFDSEINHKIINVVSNCYSLEKDDIEIVFY